MAENKEIEAALKACEEKFLKIFQEGPLALLLTSVRDDRYIEVNDAFERITGWDRSEVIGRTPYDINLLVDPSQRVNAVTTLLAGGTFRNREVLARLKNGEIRTALVSTTLIEANGETCVLSLAEDITDLKRAQEATQIVERLSSLSRKLITGQDQERASIARQLHEYIDRLMLLSADLDRVQPNSPELGQVSEEVRRARQGIENLARDIETLSNSLYYSKLEYLGLTAAATSFCRQLSDREKVKIDFVSEGIPDGLPKEISLCLFRVLQEALRNATQYSDSGKFQVALGVESDEIHLTVRHEGIGLDTEAIPEGAEFAFSIMRERLKLVDGGFSVDSRPQRGTTIRACVPLSHRRKAAGGSE